MFVLNSMDRNSRTDFAKPYDFLEPKYYRISSRQCTKFDEDIKRWIFLWSILHQFVNTQYLIEHMNINGKNNCWGKEDWRSYWVDIWSSSEKNIEIVHIGVVKKSSDSDSDFQILFFYLIIMYVNIKLLMNVGIRQYQMYANLRLFVFFFSLLTL